MAKSSLKNGTVESASMLQPEMLTKFEPAQNYTYDEWMITRDQYLNWISDFLTNKKNDPGFIWKGFNLWYITLLAKKDVESDNEWFRKIHERVNGYSQPTRVTTMPIHLFLMRFIRLFLYDLMKLFLCKWIASRVKKPSNPSDIFFHSLSSNLQVNNGVSFDRNYKYAPLSDTAFGQHANYLVFLVLGKNDVRHFFEYTKTILGRLQTLGRNVVILNRFLSIKNILSIYSASLRSWIEFRKECKIKQFEGAFYINGIFCGDILINEIEKSFLGEIQWSLVYGISFEEWIYREKVNGPVSIVTYGESLSPIRPVYFFSKKVNPSTRFFSIQHSMNSRNKMALYHRIKEFISASGESADFNLLPDYYLLQGDQFLRITTEFYPTDRSKIIGCLKYDDMVLSDDLKRHKRSKVIARMQGCHKPIMLIAPSVSDAASLVSLFSEGTPEGWRVILCPHPATRKDTIERLITQSGDNIKIEVIDDLKTTDFYTVANIVVCGYSASAYEAVMNLVPAIQYADLSSIPLVEPTPEIPFFDSKTALWEWFSRYEEDLQAKKMGVFRNIIVENFFYKNDGKAKDRLWDFIVKSKT